MTKRVTPAVISGNSGWFVCNMSEPKKYIKTLGEAFKSHPRQWRDFRYVYPVISRRSKGLSIGVNLNPDTACNFDCVYCCVDRTKPPAVRKVDMVILESELRFLLDNREKLFFEPEFENIPAEYRRLNDIAFSGNGEPTICPVFDEAAHLAADLRREYGLSEAKIIIITNGAYLTRPNVAKTLAFLDEHNGEIWAKLDAGTEAYFQKITRAKQSLSQILENIREAGKIRPLVIQSLFMMVNGEGPSDTEINEYVSRLREAIEQGAKISLVQVYTVARKTAISTVSPLPIDRLEQIGDRLRMIGLAAECYG